MSFEEFPRDVVENFKDPGLVYTRNKYGRLHSPPGYHLQGRSEKSHLSNEIIKDAQCCVKTGNMCYCPRSLFAICLNFVARNITMVESLIGFPDIVGEQLFKQIYSNDRMDPDLQTLKLFCEAYGGLVLSSLSLAGQHLFVNNSLEFIQCFTALSELDVSHCRLGDGHELLTHIAHLSSIKRLSLKNNCLSDAGVAKVTMPCRMFRVGLKQLVTLDLSLNPAITDKTIRYLDKLISLESLNLSGSTVTLPGGVRKLQKMKNFCLAKQIDEFSRDEFVTNSGWACQFIQQLINQANRHSEGKAVINKNSTTTFYKTKSRREIAKPVSCHRQEPRLSNVILLQLEKLVATEFIICWDQPKSCMKDQSKNNVKEMRSITTQKCGYFPAKAREIDGSDKEAEIIASYLHNYNTGSCSRKDASSLSRNLYDT